MGGQGTNLAPASNEKLRFLAGLREKTAEWRRDAIARLAEFRKNPPPLSSADLLQLMESIGTNGRGTGEMQSHSLRAELVFLLSTQSNLSLPQVYEVLGCSDSTIAALRRRDPELDECVRLYQAAFFEREAVTGEHGLHPALVIFGLKARAGWIDAKEGAVTLEQIQAMAERFIAIIREEVKDPATIDRIVRRLTGEPIQAQVVK